MTGFIYDDMMSERIKGVISAELQLVDPDPLKFWLRPLKPCRSAGQHVYSVDLKRTRHLDDQILAWEDIAV